MRSPIAIVGYNRPDYLRECLEALSRCNHVEEYEAFFFLDAPNRSKKDDIRLCDEVYGIARNAGGYSKRHIF